MNDFRLTSSGRLVVIATSDLLLFFLVKQALDNEYMIVNILPEKLSLGLFLNSEVIFTTKDEFTRIPEKFLEKVEIIDPRAVNFIELKYKILKTSEKMLSPKSVVIGVDPGEHLGFAMFVDERLLFARELQDLTELKNILKDIVTLFDISILTVKIGNGTHLHSLTLKDMIEKNFPRINVLLVDEKRTSYRSRKKNRIYSNINAAIEISKR